MRKHHRLGPRGIVRLVLGEPPSLADREGSYRNAANSIGPCLRASPFAHEIIGCCCRPSVIPQQRISNWFACGVEGHHSVLLPGYGDRRDAIEHAIEGCAECRPPSTWIDRGAFGVRGPCLPNQFAGIGIANDDLDRLGGGINSGDECHVAEARAQTRGRPECAGAAGYPAHREEHLSRSPGRHP